MINIYLTKDGLVSHEVSHEEPRPNLKRAVKKTVTVNSYDPLLSTPLHECREYECVIASRDFAVYREI